MADAALSALFDGAQVPPVKMIACADCGVLCERTSGRQKRCVECRLLIRPPMAKSMRCMRCHLDCDKTNPAQKYCLTCSSEVERERDRARRNKGVLGAVFLCEVCGCDAPRKRGGQKFCGDCQSAGIAEGIRSRKRLARRAAGKKVLGEELQCTCGATFLRRAAKHYRCDECREGRRAEKKTIACVDCGVVVPKTGTSQKRCPPCGVEAQRRSARRSPVEKFCNVCSDPISSRRKYCSPCAAEVRRRRDAERQKKIRKDPDKGEAIKARDRARPRTDADREYIRAYEKRRKAEDPKFALTIHMRTMMRDGLRRVGFKKAGNSWTAFVDYTVDELKDHLERQFLPGMTWENRGVNGWHIDHIIPIASFDYDGPEHPDFKACWALTNLRPLWASDNIRKSDERLFLV